MASSDYDVYARTNTAGNYYGEIYQRDENRLSYKEYKSTNKELKERSDYYAGYVSKQDKSIRQWGSSPEATAKIKYSGLSSNDRYYKNRINETYSSNLSRPEKKKQYDTYIADYNKTQDSYASSVASRLYAQK